MEDTFPRDIIEELPNDKLREKLSVTKIQSPSSWNKRNGKDRAIISKLSSYKGKQRVLNETRSTKSEGIYAYDYFSNVTETIRKQNWKNVKVLWQQSKYVVLVYDKFVNGINCKQIIFIRKVLTIKEKKQNKTKTTTTTITTKLKIQIIFK